MIATCDAPRTYAPKVYHLQAEIRRRRRERLAAAPDPTPWRVPRTQLPPALIAGWTPSPWPCTPPAR